MKEINLLVVYDRSAKNVVRPNPNGSAISTEGSAEPQPILVKILVKFWFNVDQNIAES